ncbi:MAG: hypothetical protein K0S44_1833 [Bacteroidetes bacterium]|jgi:hypothetical protein|nr:hypothetical protein [Bacteroidota bacterium]
MDRMLKIYSDKKFIPQGRSHTVMLYPYWGLPSTERKDPDAGRYEEYIQNGKEIIELVDKPEAADYILFPSEFSFEQETIDQANALSAIAGKNNKKMIVFFNSDYEEKIPVLNIIVLRTTFFKSTRDKNEFAVPGWSIDFGKIKNSVPIKKAKRPSVSYCGYVDYLNLKEQFNLRKWYRKIFHNSRVLKMHEKGSMVRGRAVRTLLKDERIETNFIIRNGFWAAGMDQQTARNQYMDNMNSSVYAIAARGAGNYSYRLYEILSCGRIPVFINTDCVLPFEEIVDWKKIVIWIDESEQNTLADRLVNFHESLGEEELILRQQACRKFYEEYICPVGFFKNLYKILEYAELHA